MNRIIGGGYYGMKNYGDDLFGIVSALAAKEFWADDEFRLMCPPIKGLDASYAVPGWFSSDIYASFNALGKASRLAFLLKSLSQADRYVFCGGSVFSSTASGARDIVTRFSQRGLALSAVGVSIGPFSDTASERVIKSLLQRFEYISLRDTASYEIAQSFGLDCPVVMAGDLAGLMPRYYPAPSEHKYAQVEVVKKVAFSPCNLPESPVKALGYCDDFVKAIATLTVDSPLEVTLLNLNAHSALGDRALCEYTQARLNAECGTNAAIVNYSDVGVLGMWRIISMLDSYVSVRLHGAISAFLMGVPFSLFEYHPKCSEFLVSIKKENSLRLAGGGVGLKNIVLQHLERKEDLSEVVGCYSNAAALNFTSAPWARKLV